MERKVYQEVPPRVEYTLTEKGRLLEGVFIELKRFGLFRKLGSKLGNR